MAISDDAAKLDTLAKLAQSRAEIRHMLEPPPRRAHIGPDAGNDDSVTDGERAPADGVFPRSHTMRVLMSGRGIGTIGAIVGGLALARPALALKLLRMLPTGALARMAVVKAVTAFRSRD
jgi:hypothetical protein